MAGGEINKEAMEDFDIIINKLFLDDRDQASIKKQRSRF